MNASPFIVPHLIPYKELIGIVADIEKEIKGSNVQAGKSNTELLADFLNGGVDIPVTAHTPAEPIIDSIPIEPMDPVALSTDAIIYTPPLTSQPSPT